MSDQQNIKEIINTYAPGGSTGQSQANTDLYVKSVTNYMKTNWVKAYQN